jgi:hypothetical protein
LPLLAVEDQVHPGVNRVVLHPGVGGDAGLPVGRVLAAKVVDLAGELVFAA